MLAEEVALKMRARLIEMGNGEMTKTGKVVGRILLT